MPIVTLDYVSTNDENDSFLHVEHLNVPDDLHTSVATYLEHLQTADHKDPDISHNLDNKTEILIKNLLSHGATRRDLEDGTPAITVYRFDHEHEALAYRSGDVVQEDHQARKVFEKSFDEKGEHRHTLGYNRSGIPEFAKFGNKHSEFLGNFDTPEKSFAEMARIVTMHYGKTDVIRMSPAYAVAV